MLVLTRRVGEKLVIGNEIVVEVLSVSGEGIRLGITAPRETSVHRFEVFEEISAANRAASTLSSPAHSEAIGDLASRLRTIDGAEEKSSSVSNASVDSINPEE